PLLVHRAKVAQAHRAAGRGPPATGAHALRAPRRPLHQRVQPPALRAAGREAPGPDARPGARGMAPTGAGARRRDPAALAGRVARSVADAASRRGRRALRGRAPPRPTRGAHQPVLPRAAARLRQPRGPRAARLGGRSVAQARVAPLAAVALATGTGPTTRSA